MTDVAEARATGVQPTTLAEYQAIDFGAGSALRGDLLARVEREAELGEIPLSDIAGEVPTYLTPEMRAWFQEHVAFHRTPALEELKKRFAHDKAHGGAPTCIVEAVRHEVEDGYHAERRQLREQYLHSRRDDRQALATLNADAEQAQAAYAGLQTGLGREPTLFHPALYALVLAAIGVTELLINFEAFLSLPWATPFIATGLTAGVAACIAAAAHFHGKVLKQFRAYFEDHVDQKTRESGLHRIWGGLTLLLVALGAVYYARDTYLTQSYLVDLSLGGEASSLFRKLWTIGGSLIGNFGVYLLGGFAAFQMHDENPHFPALKTKLTRLNRQRDRLARELSTAESVALRPAESRRRRLLEELGRREQAQKAAPAYAENRKLFEDLTAQDARVLGVLEAYRNALCQKVRGRKVVFLRKDDVEPGVVHRLSAADYPHLPLVLKYN